MCRRCRALHGLARQRRRLSVGSALPARLRPQNARAVGTSLIVIAALSVPTLATHWALGHIDWTVAFAFAAGMLPGSMAGSNLADRVAGPSLRRAFGWFLIGFGTFFTVYRIAHL